MKFLYKIICTGLFAITPLLLIPCSAQVSYKAPAAEDTMAFGKNISRTMNLLATSTPTKRNTVKILVYGQSISEQKWWLDVKSDLERRFPHANLIMENKAIGGFASQLLVKPMYFDVMPFYPDLILFHVYGSQHTYDSIAAEIRRYTTAEIALQGNHGVPGPDATTANWEDYMSYVVMPRVAEKYKLEVMDIRTPWGKYVDDNNLNPRDLTTDGLHLNDHGNFLLGALIKRRLVYNPELPVDPYDLVRTYEVGSGKQVSLTNGELSLPFKGNKVDLIASPYTGPADSAAILIDGKKPSEFPSCYAFTHPNESAFRGGILKITSQSPLILEDWTATINTIDCAPKACSFSFSVKGSKTGDDGSGRVAFDSTGKSTSRTFISNSKRIIIRAEDWFVRDLIVGYKRTINPGFEIKWSVIPMFRDHFTYPTTATDPSIENITVAAQGLANTDHILSLKAIGNKNIPIKQIRTYSPYVQPNITHVNAANSSDKEYDITLYPNPATDQLSISSNVANTIKYIATYNAQGQKIDLQDMEQSLEKTSLNVRPLQPGVYLVEFENNGKVFREKFNKL